MTEPGSIKLKRPILFASLLLFGASLLLLTSTAFTTLLFNTADTILSKHLDRSFWTEGIQYAAVDLIILSLLSAPYFYNPAVITTKYFFVTSLAFVIHFYCEVAANAVNMPISDDFGTAMTFLNTSISSGSITETISLIGSQYYETRLILLRSFFLLYTLLAREINFKVLLIISSLLILGIACLLIRSIKLKGDFKFLLLAIIIILLFQFQYHSGIFFLTAGMLKFCTLFFSIAAFYFISRDNRNGFLLALVCSILAALSFGNGMLSLFICLAFLLYKGRYVQAGIWGFTTVIFLFCYFHNYTAMLTEPISISLISRSFLYGLIFLGNSMQFLYTITMPIIVGIIIWCFAIALTIKKYYRENPAIYCTLLFILLSSLIAAPFRLSESESVSKALFTHYGIYSIIAICCCLIGFIELFVSQKYLSKTMQSLVLLSIAYHLASDLMFFPEVNVRKNNLVECIYPWVKNNPASHAPPCSDIIANPDNAGLIILQSEELNIYHLPDLQNED